MRKMNISQNDHILKCKLCKHNMSQLDYRHVYEGICFQCITDILFFLQTYDAVEFDSACEYAKKKSREDKIDA